MFHGVSEKSIVIMDNCSIHHVAEVKHMFMDSGIAYTTIQLYKIILEETR